MTRRTEPAAEVAAWRHAAAEGDADAMVHLARIASRSPEGRDEALGLWREAARLGNTVGMYKLGLFLIEHDEAAEGEQWLRKAAVAGDHEAIAALAFLLWRRGDREEAETWEGRLRERG